MMRARPGGPGRGMGNATIAQKPISFVASGKRVLARLRPQRLRIFAVIAAGVLSVGLGSLTALYLKAKDEAPAEKKPDALNTSA